VDGTRPQSVAAGPAATTRPNVLVVMADDQPFGMYSRELMPTVFSQIVDQGVAFDRAYINTPLCCPSRAQTLTGLFEHNTGVADNQSEPLARPSIVEALKSAGYRTMLAGKYLNSANCNPRPEFDRWSCYSKTSTGYSLVNPVINVDGKLAPFTGYTTDILAGMVNDFVASTPADQPFFALYTPTSPHLPADDPRYASLPVAPNRPQSFDEDVVAAHKPAYLRPTPLTKAQIATDDKDHAAMTRAVPALDDSIRTILDGLGPRADNTIVVYFSDNGFLFGEHRWHGKAIPYDESVHVPFAVRYPPLTANARGTVSHALVQNIDIAPTIAELARIPWTVDGRSLVPVLAGSASRVRDAALIEACDGTVPGCWSSGGRTTRANLNAVPFYRGVVTDQYKYLEYVTGERELYDLGADAGELHNLAGDPSVADVQAALTGDLTELMAPPPPETTLAVTPPRSSHNTLAVFRWFTQSARASYRCKIDTPQSDNPWAPCGEGLQLTLVPGTYRFSVVGTDEAGVTDPTPASTTFSVKAGGPDVHFSARPAGLSTNKAMTFAFASSRSDVTFVCRTWLRSASPPRFKPCTSPVGYSGLSDGTRRFEVAAVDAQGTRTTSPAAWQYTVDTVGPSMDFEQHPAKSTTSRVARFVFNPGEHLQGPSTCNLDQKPTRTCSPIDAVSYNTPLSAGKHTFSVTATDVAGNTRKSSFTWTITA
jgi:arylsulfatase A-like enzyme